MSAATAVLNPGGRDRFQAFSDGAGEVDDAVHAPVNDHAYAACTRGVFCRTVSEIPAEVRSAVLLLRGDFKETRAALTELRASGRTVAVAFKEAGVHQVAAQLADAKRLARFLEICAEAQLALASTPELVPLFRGAGTARVAFIPTPYPVDDPRWDFSVPLAERRGIFIGTREFEVPSRHHAGALLVARQLSAETGQPVTVVNTDGRKGRARLAAFGFPEGLLRIEEGRRPYSEYLRMIARHRLVFQLDRSAVPGQVAGDAALCRVPCVGGDGAVDRIVGQTDDPVAEAFRLLREPRAAEPPSALSFDSGRAALVEFFSVALASSQSSKPRAQR